MDTDILFFEDTEVLMSNEMDADALVDSIVDSTHNSPIQTSSGDESESAPPPGRGRGRIGARARGARGVGRRGRAGKVNGAPKRGRGVARRPRGRRANDTNRDVRYAEEAELLQSREEALKEKINNLSTARLKELMLISATRDATVSEMVFQNEQGPPPNTPTETSLEWCTCLKCVDMPTQRENVCCGMNPEFCKSEAPGFNIAILDRQVLRLAMRHRNDLLAEANLGPNATVEEINRSYRYAAYRQYVLESYGRLGMSNRRVIPSCCVKKIRRTFPDPSGEYKGYMDIDD